MMPLLVFQKPLEKTAGLPLNGPSITSAKWASTRYRHCCCTTRSKVLTLAIRFWCPMPTRVMLAGQLMTLKAAIWPRSMWPTTAPKTLPRASALAFSPRIQSVGWLLKKLFFRKNNFLTLLKFRGSYGKVGNDQIGAGFLFSNNRFLYRPTAWTFTGGSRFGEVGSSFNLLPGVQEGRGSNPDLTWEQAVKTNLGIELSFWKKSLSLTIDVFEEARNNILASPQSVSSLFGVAVPPLNLGRMRNWGYEFEFALNHNLGAFSYQIKGNYSFARNKILFQDEVNRVYPYQYRTGNRIGQYFGLIAEGLYNTWDEVNDAARPVYEWQNNKIQPGDIRYKDVNGDGKINFDDEMPIGYSQVPEEVFGLSLVMEYKGFSLSLLFQGVSNVSLNYTRRYNQAFYDANPAGAGLPDQ